MTIQPGMSLGVSSLAADMFVAWARFEASIIAAGLVRGEVGKRAEPCWSQFTGRLKAHHFFDQIRDCPEIAIFFDQPPRKLCVKEPGQTEWRNWRERIVAETKLFEVVRQVRNNLFHGGKLWVRPRDDELIRAALFVLDAAIEVSRSHPDLEAVAVHFIESTAPAEGDVREAEESAPPADGGPGPDAGSVG